MCNMNHTPEVWNGENDDRWYSFLSDGYTTTSKSYLHRRECGFLLHFSEALAEIVWHFLGLPTHESQARDMKWRKWWLLIFFFGRWIHHHRKILSSSLGVWNSVTFFKSSSRDRITFSWFAYLQANIFLVCLSAGQIGTFYPASPSHRI